MKSVLSNPNEIPVEIESREHGVCRSNDMQHTAITLCRRFQHFRLKCQVGPIQSIHLTQIEPNRVESTEAECAWITDFDSFASLQLFDLTIEIATHGDRLMKIDDCRWNDRAQFGLSSR